mgnify:FL=1|tara:strand:- start:64648 stop:64902 length:255 start_codon:yes stop_codon:yes gene_type:complete
MKNRLTDLNDHLFAQLERLSEEGISAEQIDQEVTRADAMVKVADKIIGNASMALKACDLLATHGDRFRKHLPMISAPEDPDFSK